jgi:predicted TPR repeat methyltransferase
MTRKTITNIDVVDDALNLDGTPEAVRQFYDKWADHYDKDVAELGYSGPAIMVELFDKHAGLVGKKKDSTIVLDAGCGTGLIGEQLQRLGYPKPDGFDLSPEMARQAAAGGKYRTILGDIDIMVADETFGTDLYDAVLCAGVFTLGHVAPEALNVLIRLARLGGLLLISTRSEYYDETNYRQVSDDLIEAGRVEVIEAKMNASYLNGSSSHFWVYRKTV